MVRSSCRNHYQLEVFSAILSHLISPKAMADVSHATSKLIANIGKLATIIFERVMANEWQSSELNVIQLLSLLRQVIDDSGTIYPLAETAFGAAFIRPTVEALFKSVNGIMLLTLSRAHANLEFFVQAVSLIVADNSVFLAQGNKDIESIPLYVNHAISLHEAAQRELHESGLRLWRALMKHRMKDLVGMCATPFAVPLNISALSEDEFTRKASIFVCFH